MFFEVEFPRQIGFSSTGGATWSTSVNEGFSGFEQRNRSWSQSRAKFQVQLNGKPQAYFQQVHDFYMNVGGMADAFRFFWPIDCEATAQIIGTVAAPASPPVFPVYQLIKTYVTGSRTYTRKITKPIMASVSDFQGNALTNTVKIYDNGSLKTLSSDYTVDATTGLVTFLYLPTTGHVITADFQFHFPVRFSVDEMKAQIIESDIVDGNGLVSWDAVDLIEVRL